MNPSDYFSYLRDCFHGNIVKQYQIGGLYFTLHFQDQDVYDALSPCLQEVEASKGELSIFVMKEPVLPPYRLENYGKKGELKELNRDGFQAVYDSGSKILSMINREEKQGIYCIRSREQIPYWERGAPFRNLIHWFLQLKDRYLVHAAAVAGKNGAALIVGAGGAGKSTTALSCLDTSLSYISDDYCAVGNNSTPTCYSTFSSAKVHPHTLEKLGLAFVNSREEKVVLTIPLTLKSSPIKYLVYPQKGKHQETSLQPIRKGVVLREFALSTMLQLPGENRNVFPFLRQIVELIPTFALQLTPNYKQNGAFMEKLLEGV